MQHHYDSTISTLLPSLSNSPQALSQLLLISAFIDLRNVSNTWTRIFKDLLPMPPSLSLTTPPSDQPTIFTSTLNIPITSSPTRPSSLTANIQHPSSPVAQTSLKSFAQAVSSSPSHYSILQQLFSFTLSQSKAHLHHIGINDRDTNFQKSRDNLTRLKTILNSTHIRFTIFQIPRPPCLTSNQTRNVDLCNAFTRDQF